MTSTGDLSVAGKVSAKGRAAEGGRIDLSGKDIRLTGAKVNASGATGGGLVRIGGAFRGGTADPSNPLYQAYVGRWGALPPIAAANTVAIDAATTDRRLRAQNGRRRHRRHLVERKTSFAGDAAGHRSENSGPGGYAEVSSKGVLGFPDG